jgi:hypothetical protein
MGRGQAQAHQSRSGQNCPHCVSGDIIQPLHLVKGVHVNQPGVRMQENARTADKWRYCAFSHDRYPLPTAPA